MALGQGDEWMLELNADQPVAPGQARRVFPIKFVIAGAIVLVAIAYLVFTGLSSASVYYLTVGELKAQGVGDGRPVRVSGDVVPGTIVRDGGTLRFDVTDGAGTLPVVYQGVVPDIFADEVQVVVEGKTDPNGVFQANTLLAKCPSKFEAATPGGIA